MTGGSTTPVRALVTGVTGQDGSYLADYLTSLDRYEVWGVVRDLKHPRCDWLKTVVPSIRLITGNVLDRSSLTSVLSVVQPAEIYNLAAVTSPGAGWGDDVPELLGEVTALGPVKLLQAVADVVPHARVVHASSSAVYDPMRYGLYGAAKKLAHDAVAGYRDCGLHASNAVMYSHTSPRQSSSFLIRRIVAHIVARMYGGDTELRLTNIDSRRSWGYAGDYVRAMHRMAHSDPGDYFVRTIDRRSVYDVIETTLEITGADWECMPRMVNIGVPTSDAEPNDCAISAARLGWVPRVSFRQLIRMLVEAEEPV